ncbi:MAG: hypothetical protein ACR2PT_10295 [Endozoicomonas sp.]
MATTNIWQQFKSLIPEGARTIVTIISNNGNGTSQAQLRDGTAVTVRGESVTVGLKQRNNILVEIKVHWLSLSTE